MCALRLHEQRRADPQRFIDQLRESDIAVATDLANLQHYEVPVTGNFPAMYGGFYAVGDTLYLVTADNDMASAASAGGRLLQFRRSDNNGDTWTNPSRSTPVRR